MSSNFSINEKIVYPSQGVGEIKEIFERTVGENTVPYYRIYLEVSDMVVMVPVDNAVKLGIRKIVSAEAAQSRWICWDSLLNRLPPTGNSATR